MSRHRLANPSCPFVQNQSNNVPLGNPAENRTDAVEEGVEAEEDMVGGGGGVESHEDIDDAGIDISRLHTAGNYRF